MKKKLFALLMTVLWSIVFVHAMHDVTIGICMGLLIGLAFGLFSDEEEGEEWNDEEE